MKSSGNNWKKSLAYTAAVALTAGGALLGSQFATTNNSPNVTQEAFLEKQPIDKETVNDVIDKLSSCEGVYTDAVYSHSWIQEHFNNVYLSEFLIFYNTDVPELQGLREQIPDEALRKYGSMLLDEAYIYFLESMGVELPELENSEYAYHTSTGYSTYFSQDVYADSILYDMEQMSLASGEELNSLFSKAYLLGINMSTLADNIKVGNITIQEYLNPENDAGSMARLGKYDTAFNGYEV